MLMSLDTSTTSRPVSLLAERLHDAEDLVVGLALRQPGRQRRVDERRLEEELAAGLAMTGPRERQALAHVGGAVAAEGAGGERVEIAAHLARVARDLAHALLVIVEFLERDHRQVDVVLLESEERHRVVHQHVGIEHEQARRAGTARRARAALRGGLDGLAWRRSGACFGACVGALTSDGAARVSNRSSTAGAAGSAAAGDFCARRPGRGAACDSKSFGFSREAGLAGGLGRGMGWRADSVSRV